MTKSTFTSVEKTSVNSAGNCDWKHTFNDYDVYASLSHLKKNHPSTTAGGFYNSAAVQKPPIREMDDRLGVQCKKHSSSSTEMWKEGL